MSAIELKRSVMVKKPNISSEAPAKLTGLTEGVQESKHLAPFSSGVDRGSVLLGRRRGIVRLNRRKPRRARRSRLQGKSVPPMLPPTIDATVVVGHRFRFRNNADITSVSITAGNLIGICGTIGTVTNTTVVSIASSVKLRRITIWPSVEAESGTDHNPEISFASSTYGTVGDRSKNKSIPGGVTNTAPIVGHPGPDTLAALWQNSSTTSSVLFTLYDIPKNSVVDVEVSFCLRNSQNGVSYSVTTAVVGTMYYLYLDGSTAVLLPIALPNTH